MTTTKPTDTMEYLLSPSSTRMDLMNVLEHLRDDAKDKATPLAMFHTQHGDEGRRSQAMYYFGQMDLIATLIWALDGTAIRDGIENPTVSIRCV